MDIDEFSRKWGAMEEKQDSLEKTLLQNNTVSNEKLDKIIDKLTTMNGSIGKAHGRIDDMEDDLEEAVKNGEDWKSTKKTAKYIIGGSVIAGGTSGAGIGTWLSKILGS